MHWVSTRSLRVKTSATSDLQAQIGSSTSYFSTSGTVGQPTGVPRRHPSQVLSEFLAGGEPAFLARSRFWKTPCGAFFFWGAGFPGTRLSSATSPLPPSPRPRSRPLRIRSGVTGASSAGPVQADSITILYRHQRMRFNVHGVYTALLIIVRSIDKTYPVSAENLLQAYISPIAYEKTPLASNNIDRLSCIDKLRSPARHVP